MASRHKYALSLCLAAAACAVAPLSPPLPAAAAVAQAGGRPADPLAAGKTVHFTLDKEEEKDFSISLAPGSYYLQWDMQLPDGESTNIQATADLLKTNGSLVEGRILSANEIGKTARVAKVFKVAKPLAARIRVKNASMPMEFWMTVVPAAKKTFLPFAFPDGDLKPLGVGANNGKGGTLDKKAYAYHTIKLAPGKYDVSLYMKQPDNDKTNLQGKLDLMDAFGVPSPMDWRLHVNEIGLDTRQEKRLLLLKPQTLIFRVTNDSSFKPVEYIVGIEKATD
jgi:hypothetical protein